MSKEISSNGCLLINLILVAILGIVMINLAAQLDKARRPINVAVNQCETELPRHLYCEPVYGARVVEPTEQGE